MRRSASDSPAEVRLPLDAIRIGRRSRKYMGDIPGLAASIEASGLLHPVVVTPERDLIAGERRIAAVRLLGWSTVPVTVVTPADMLRAENDENVVRLDFAPSEAADIAALLRPIEERKARERQGTRTDLTSRKLTGRSDSRDRIAAAVGVSGKTLEKIEAVMAAAEADPEMGDLVTEMDETGKVDTAYKKLVRRRVVAVIEAEPSPMPQGPFRVIAADPPWTYGSRAEDGTHRAANPYPSMTNEEIAALPVGERAHDDCILWLWTTNAHMEHAFGIVRAWGFEPKTILTWAKDRMGTGDWLRGQTEHCLMAVRGKPTVTLTNQTTLLHGPMREHSRKPDEFYAMVEALCPGSKLELFAREGRDGWERWGAEA